MSGYVDSMRDVQPKGNWPYGRACHLYADTLDELHEMAGLIGLSRSWFHNRKDFPHYDLTGYKRRQAVARFAVETDAAHAVEFMYERREERLKANKKAKQKWIEEIESGGGGIALTTKSQRHKDK